MSDPTDHLQATGRTVPQRGAAISSVVLAGAAATGAAAARTGAPDFSAGSGPTVSPGGRR